MKVIRPVAIAGATLLASNVVEADYPEWQAGTTYPAKARVIRAARHRIYESVAGGNTGHAPEETIGTHWLDVGPTGRWAMFDESGGTLTSRMGEITVTIRPGAINAMALLDVAAEIVRVRMINAGAVVYDRTQSTAVGGRAIATWYDYFFEPIGKRTKLTFLDLPIYPQAEVEVTLTGAAGATVAIGTLAVGRAMEIGLTLRGGSIGFTDFSLKETNAFGTTTIVRRGYADVMTLPTTMPKARTDLVKSTLAGLRATACVWIGEEDYLDALILYGFFNDLSIDLTYPHQHYCSLTITALSQP